MDSPKPYQFACWNPDIKPTWYRYVQKYCTIEKQNACTEGLYFVVEYYCTYLYPPKEIGVYNKIGGWLKTVFQGKDYSNGADYYNNLSIEGYPEWTKNCVVTVKIGQHVFYKER